MMRFGVLLVLLLAACAPAPAPVAVFIGDSITGGAPFYETPWPVATSQLLGWEMHNLAVPGSGYIGGTGGNFDAQIAKALALEPDILVIAGGVGDTGRAGGPAAVEVAANAVLDAVASVPIVYVLSPMPGQSGLGFREVYGNAARVPIGEAIRHAAEAHGRQYIDMLDPAWVYGTGTSAEPGGDGNADLYMAGDAIHLNQAGEDYVAGLLADELR